MVAGLRALAGSAAVVSYSHIYDLSRVTTAMADGRYVRFGYGYLLRADTGDGKGWLNRSATSSPARR